MIRRNLSWRSQTGRKGCRAVSILDVHASNQVFARGMYCQLAFTQIEPCHLDVISHNFTEPCMTWES